uniref:RRM domain-containing protein n=1 Tax=Percolomonas cosmopolitus TaxID=63605 RepID=A0A7S1KS96_9EUKA|mmetsp:Transcript_74/g.269  ORF Transcript_74/g.269 Transcript_74/m.269 type:complete len:815 (+) Transcript_74:2-2446(+)
MTPNSSVSRNLLLFTLDKESFHLSLIDSVSLSIRDERQFERSNLDGLVQLISNGQDVSEEHTSQFSDSCLVVDENSYLQFLHEIHQGAQPKSSHITPYFQKYHSLQKAFSVHLVTLSSYNNNINRDALKDPFPESQLESDNHKKLLKLMMTLLKQGFKFLKPTVLKEQIHRGNYSASSKAKQSSHTSHSRPNIPQHESSPPVNTSTEQPPSSEQSPAQTASDEHVSSSVNQSSEDSNSQADDSAAQSSTNETAAPAPPIIVDTSVLRLRGLPWTATSADIEKFFADVVKVENPENDILIVLNFHGRSTGEAYVKFSSVEETQEAALKKDRAHMGHRYIELFPASEEEMEKSRSIMERELKELGNSSVARMRGLPQGTKKEEIHKFFEGLHEKIVKILLLPRETSRGPGGAYVEFESPEVVEEALKRNKEKIGTRYIELFRSTKAEMTAAERYLEQLEQYKANSGDKDRPFLGRRFKKFGKRRSQNSGGQRRQRSHTHNNYGMQMMTHHMMRHEKFSDAVVRLRGLPFNADEVDIAEFFGDLPIVERGIHFIYNSNDGKKTGEAYVEFASVEAKQEAMKKDRATMGKRYIEIFSSAGPRGHSNHHSQRGDMNPLGAGFNMPSDAQAMQGYYPNPQTYMAMMQQWYAMMMGMSPTAYGAAAAQQQWGVEEASSQQQYERSEQSEEYDEQIPSDEQQEMEASDQTAENTEAITSEEQEAKDRLDLNVNATEFVPVFNPNQMMMSMMSAYQMGVNPMMFYSGMMPGGMENAAEHMQQEGEYADTEQQIVSEEEKAPEGEEGSEEVQTTEQGEVAVVNE